MLAMLRKHVRAKTMGAARPRGAQALSPEVAPGASLNMACGSEAIPLACSMADCVGKEEASPAGRIQHRSRQDCNRSGSGGGSGDNAPVALTVDTLRSRVPLKWAAASGMAAAGSSYAAAYGGNATRSAQVRAALSLAKIPAYGAVDPHVHAGSRRGPLPVELRWLQVRLSGAAPWSVRQQTPFRAHTHERACA